MPQNLIAIDARMIDHSGIGTYLRGLLGHFTEAQFQQLVLLGPSHKLKSFPCRVVEFSAPIYSLREQWSLPSLLKKLSPGLLHVPHYNIPCFYGGRLITTVHDLNHILFPWDARSRLARCYARIVLSAAVRKSACVLTDSNRIRQDLVRFGAEESRIKVIPLGVNEVFRPQGDKIVSNILARYSLDRGYILYAGNLRRIKNVPGLLEAYRLLRKRKTNVPTLVLVGRNQLSAATHPFSGHPGVRSLGEVSPDDLLALYSGAGVFAFPSFYEGFGFPPLEAMACGCPVVASTGGSLPEVLGEAALFSDPRDIPGLSSNIERVLSDRNLRTQLIDRGSQQVARYRWEKTVQRTFEIYHEFLK